MALELTLRTDDAGQLTVTLDGQRHTTVDRLAVEHYGASAALAGSAAIFYAGQHQRFPQHLQQGHMRWNGYDLCFTIDGQGNGVLRHSVLPVKIDKGTRGRFSRNPPMKACCGSV